MTRLETARNTAEEMEKRRSRVQGELEATKKRQGEVETTCGEKFDCKTSALPAFMDELKEEVVKSLVNAEGVLGLREPDPDEKAKAEEPEDDGDEDALA